MNEKKEYLSVIDISKKYNQTPRNVRRKIKTLEDSKAAELLYKDSRGEWQIHELLVSKFKPQRVPKQKYYALTIDPSEEYSVDEIDVIMAFVIGRMENPNIEINYVTEQKKANGRNHVHCFINCDQRKKLIENLRLGFSKLNYHQSDIYDLDGWKQYITKDESQIKTLKTYE